MKMEEDEYQIKKLKTKVWNEEGRGSILAIGQKRAALVFTSDRLGDSGDQRSAGSLFSYFRRSGPKIELQRHTPTSKPTHLRPDFCGLLPSSTMTNSPWSHWSGNPPSDGHSSSPCSSLKITSGLLRWHPVSGIQGRTCHSCLDIRPLEDEEGAASGATW